MVPILINKDVFEPSYNDLKFMIQNRKKKKKKRQLHLHQPINTSYTDPTKSSMRGGTTAKLLFMSTFDLFPWITNVLNGI